MLFGSNTLISSIDADFGVSFSFTPWPGLYTMRTEKQVLYGRKNTLLRKTPHRDCYAA